MNDVFMVMALAGGAGTLVILLTIIMDRCWDWITGAGFEKCCLAGLVLFGVMGLAGVCGFNYVTTPEPIETVIVEGEEVPVYPEQMTLDEMDALIDKLENEIPRVPEDLRGDLVYPQAQRPEFLVKVAVSNSQGSDIGSGTLISPTLVLSCGHNVEDYNKSKQLFVIFNDASWSFATIKHYDRKDDISILELERPVLLPFATIREKPLEIGEDVVIHGYAQSLRYGRSAGKVDAFDNKGDHKGFRVTSRSVQGISGGPVLDAEGELVGILWASDLKTVSYCVGQEAIWQFLKKSGESLDKQE